MSGVSPLGGGGIGVFQDTSLTLVESTVSDNWTAGTAAGIGSFSPVTLIDSTVSGNVAERNAGGIGVGNPSLLTLTRSTVSGNIAGSDGGGIGTIGGPVVLINSTVSGNVAGGSGGGLIVPSSTITANSATIAFNRADADANGTGDGGGFFAAMVNASNTIVAANSDAGGQAPDCRAVFNSGGHNLIESTAGCVVLGDATGNITGRPAGLAPLTDNGGPTATHELEADSPAIDTGSPAAPGTPGACELADQRGVAREDRCDIGAFER